MSSVLTHVLTCSALIAILRPILVCFDLKGVMFVSEERLLSAKEVAGLLNVSQRMVQKIAHQGELAPVRIGDLLRFRPVDVEDYIRQRRQPPAAQGSDV